MTQIKRSVEVSIMGETTPPTSKRSSVPLSWLDRPTLRASDGGVGWGDHLDSNAHQGSEQRHTCAEVPRRVLLPADEPFRVFQGYASTRSLSHGHKLTGFSGKHLSLSGGLNPALNASFLVHRSPVPLSIQNGSEIRPLVAVRASNRSPDSHVTADKLFGLPYLRTGRPPAWDLDSYTHIPFAVLAEHFSLLTQLGSRQGQSPVDSPVPSCWEVEFSHTLDHDPEVKALSLSGILDLSSVNKLGFEHRRLELLAQGTGGFSALVKISRSSTVSSTPELPLALARRNMGLLHACHLECAIRVQATKQPRQEGQSISFVTRGMEFEFIGENHGLHEQTIAETREPRHPRRSQGPANRVSGQQCPDNASLCFVTERLGSPAYSVHHAGSKDSFP